MVVIHRLPSDQYSRVKDSLFHLLGVASLEWLHYFDVAKDKIVVYYTENLKDYMLILNEANVLIATDSQIILEDFLKQLETQKGYAFRCKEWMASTIMERFPPKKQNYNGVVLLTYATSKKDFVKYADTRYTIRILKESDTPEVVSNSGHHWSPEFILERIEKGAFYGIYRGKELISWLGVIWESDRACEIGFAFTKEQHRNKGLMKTLASSVTEKMLQKGKIPILHTVETNIQARRLAESLGYSIKVREWAYFYNL